MKKWLLQTSTLGGLIGLALAAINAIQSGLTPLNVAGAVLSAALVLVKDGAFLKGLSMACLAGLLVGSLTACGGIKLPEGVTAAVAIDVSCQALAQSKCFSDALSSVGINQGTCAADIDAAIEGRISFDWSKTAGLKKKCQRDVESLREYIIKIPQLQ